MPRFGFRRSVAVPSDALERANLARGERVLAGTVTADGTWLLGTVDALLIVDPSLVPADPSRVPWQHIESADWDRESEQLEVAEVGEFGQRRPEYLFTVSDPGLMLELIRERVTASVVLQRRVPVSGKLGLFVVARRAPRGDSEITWAYEFDGGVDPEDPVVMEAANRGLDAAAEELGLRLR